MNELKIKVLNVRFLPPGKPLRAFADIRIDDWVIYDFRITKQNGQRAFVGSPQVSWKDPETGQIKYKSVLTIPPEQKQRIEIEILSAYQKEMENLDENQNR